MPVASDIRRDMAAAYPARIVTPVKGWQGAEPRDLPPRVLNNWSAI